MALLHLVGRKMCRPLVCLVRIDGNSMVPTFNDGDYVLALRLPWRKGSIVIIEPQGMDEFRDVKRVVEVHHTNIGKIATLIGDNTAHSAQWTVQAKEVLGLVVCRLWRAQ